jgi:hypothetical protein
MKIPPFSAFAPLYSLSSPRTSIFPVNFSERVEIIPGGWYNKR